MGRDRPEPLIYMAWLRELMRELFADELGEAFEDYWEIRTEVMHRVLTKRTDWCDVATTDERGVAPPLLPPRSATRLRTSRPTTAPIWRNGGGARPMPCG